MRTLRLLAALLVGIGLTAGPAHARPAPAEDPLGGLVNPTYVDPLITLLAAMPTPYTPYDGAICASGSASCIDRVIAEMEQRLRPLARDCSHHAIFSLAYLRVTENVHEAVLSGYFDDAVWLNRVDAVFAEMYFDTMDRWSAGRAVPAPWRIALRAADDRQLNGLGDFMLNMNAHINNDFPRALVRAGLTAPDGSSHKGDHNAYNQRLDGLYAPVFAEEAARFDPTFDDYDVGPVEETVAGVIMRAWREGVWRNAEALANARTPLEKALVSRWIEEYAATQARLIKAMPIFQTADAEARRAYCLAQQ